MMRYFSFRLDEKLLKEVKRIAKKEQTSAGWIIRDALRKWVNSYKKRRR